MPNHKPWSEREKLELIVAVESMHEAEMELHFRRSFPHIRKQMVLQGLRFPEYRKLLQERASRKIIFKKHISDPDNYRRLTKNCRYFARKWGNADRADDFFGWVLEQGLQGNVVNIKYLSMRFFVKQYKDLEYKDNIDYGEDND